MKKLNKNNKGFSLVELLVVIAIMVVLVGVLAPSLLNNIEKARESKDYQALDTIAGSVQTCLMLEDVYNEVFPTNADFSADLADIYNNKDSKYTNFSTALNDNLAKASVYTSDKITLFGGKLAKTAIESASDPAYINVAINATTGEITVSLMQGTGTSAVVVPGKSVNYTVTR